MKKTIRIVISAGLLVICCSILSSPVRAQAASTTSSSTIFNFPKFNPPPFDFNDAFYGFNGMDVNLLDSMGQRFGTFNGIAVRQTGPPAFQPGQLNWVTDNSNTDPIATMSVFWPLPAATRTTEPVRRRSSFPLSPS